MDKSNIITMSLIVIAAMGVIAFLMWKNKKDEKKLNPDAQDSVQEMIMDQKLRKERI